MMKWMLIVLCAQPSTFWRACDASISAAHQIFESKADCENAAPTLIGEADAGWMCIEVHLKSKDGG